MQPSLFYSHLKQGVEAEECERRRVVKDFCFPDGVDLRPLKTVTELRRTLSMQGDLQQTYHGFTLNSANEMCVEDQSFIFSQNNGAFNLSKLQASRGRAKEIGLNCLCVQFTDLIVLVDDFESIGTLSDEQLKQLLAQDRILKTKRAFCLMFTNDLYQMHMNLLSAMLEVSKQEQRDALATL